MTQLTVREARLRRRPMLTQEVLADRVGVDQAYVSLVERLRRNPSQAIKRRFAKALGVSVSSLIFAGSPLSATTPAIDCQAVS